MQKRIFTLVLLLFVTVFTLNGQELNFNVVDRETRQPVSLAYVNLYANTTLLKTEQTDDNGNVTVKPELYPCKIKIVIAGYESYVAEYSAAPANTHATILLTKKFSSLNEVVVTGIAQPTRMKDALSAYQVIPRAVIESQGAVSLNDVLKNQLNMNVSSDAALGTSINMQGMLGNKVKILIDGMPVNGREAGNINLSQINMNNVERVEIIQGPMSVIYGSDALGGVINVITRKENKPFNINVKAYYESIGRYNATGNLTFKLLKRHQFTLGGGRNFFTGYQHIDPPVAYNGDTIRTERVLMFKPNTQDLFNFAYNYTAPSGFKIDLGSDYIKDKVTNKGSLNSWDPYNGAKAIDEYYNTSRSMNRLSLMGKVGKSGSWQMQNSYSWYYRVKNRYAVDMVSLDRTLSTGTGDQDTTSFNDVSSRGTYANTLAKFNYSVGYDINLQYASSLKIKNQVNQVEDYAAYTNISYPLVKDLLTVQGGLRASVNSKYNAPLIPSFNVLYTPIKKLQVRASYSQGFRAPSLKELYLSFIDGGTHYIIGNSNLSAEKSNHLQLSTSYQLYEKQANYIQFIITGYYNNIDNGITLVPMDPSDTFSIKYTYKNLTHQSNAIGNAQFEAQYNNMHMQAGYALNHTFKEPGQYDAFDFSEITAMLQYNWRKTGLGFNLFYKYNGKQPFLQIGIDGNATYSGVQNSYSIFDGSVEKKLFNKRVQIVAGVKNILNVKRPTITGIIVSSSHSSGTAGNFLPRSFYTSLNVNLD